MVTEKQKKIIGVVVGVGIVGITAIVYYYYRKPKELESDEAEFIKNRGIDPYDELGYDNLERMRMPKLPKSRWELAEMLASGERDVRANYGETNRNSRWRGIDAKYEDLDNHDNRMLRRNRFTVYSKENDFNENSNSLGGRMIQKRFKVLEKEESVIDRTGRFRTSGERYKHTPSGYNYNTNNRRNPNFNDLIIP